MPLENDDISEEQRLALVAVALGLLKCHERWDEWSKLNLRLLCQKMGKPFEEMEKEIDGGAEALAENNRRLCLVAQNETHKIACIKVALKACLELAMESENQGTYDSRSRALIRHLSEIMDLDWSVTECLEVITANELIIQLSGQPIDRMKRAAVFGAATLAGSGLLLVTGGLAAPALASMAGYSAAAVTFAGTSGFAAVGVGTFGVVGAGVLGMKANRLGETNLPEGFTFHALQTSDAAMSACIGVCGWAEEGEDLTEQWSGLVDLMNDKVGMYCLSWKTDVLSSLGKPMRWFLATELASGSLGGIETDTGSGESVEGDDDPLLEQTSTFISKPWQEAMTHAKIAGDALAVLLSSQAHGRRPVTLIGFSVGAKVVFRCLKSLAKLGEKGRGIVESAYLLGAPVRANGSRWETAGGVCSHRLVNCFSENDSVLRILYGGGDTGKMHMAGVGAVEAPGVENLNVSNLIKGHTQYKSNLSLLLRVLGVATGRFNLAVIDPGHPSPARHRLGNQGKRGSMENLALSRSLTDRLRMSESDETPTPVKKSPLPSRWGKDPVWDGQTEDGPITLFVPEEVLYEGEIEDDVFDRKSPLFSWMTKTVLKSPIEEVSSNVDRANDPVLAGGGEGELPEAGGESPETEGVFAKLFRLVKTSLEDESSEKYLAAAQHTEEVSPGAEDVRKRGEAWGETSDEISPAEEAAREEEEACVACEACTLEFEISSAVLTPRRLNCGHVICSRCVQELIDDGVLTCVFRCQKKTLARKVDQVPIDARFVQKK